VLTQTVMTIFQSVAGFVKAGPRGI